MWMIIDDIRDLNCDIIARTSQAGYYLLCNIDVEVLILDHDLGIHSVQNGYQLLKRLIEDDLLPNRVQLCTSNPVGLNSMKQELISAGYVSNNGLEWSKQ